MKSCLRYNDTKIHSIINEGKSIAKQFIRILKSKTYKCMIPIFGNAHVDKLPEILKKYNSIIHMTIKMKPVNVKLYIYFYYTVDFSIKNINFKVGSHVGIWKCRYIFYDSYRQDWTAELSVIKSQRYRIMGICDRRT